MLPHCLDFPARSNCKAARWWAVFPLAGAALVASLGCGGDGPETIPVHGKVTFGGGPPPAEGAVFFAPLSVEAGAQRRPGRARFGLDGAYEATSFEPGDGLVPGEYRVTVECWKTPPGMGGAGGTSGVSFVGRGFEPPTLVVASDQDSVEFNLEVPLGP
jgi:hypothetical protein